MNGDIYFDGMDLSHADFTGVNPAGNPTPPWFGKTTFENSNLRCAKFDGPIYAKNTIYPNGEKSGEGKTLGGKGICYVTRAADCDN